MIHIWFINVYFTTGQSKLYGSLIVLCTIKNLEINSFSTKIILWLYGSLTKGHLHTVAEANLRLRSKVLRLKNVFPIETDQICSSYGYGSKIYGCGRKFYGFERISRANLRSGRGVSWGAK
jgi:hypothetical protein